MGITYFKERDKDISDAMKRVDKAMYISKGKGKEKINVL